MKRISAIAAACLSATVFAGAQQAAPGPDAAAMLRGARMSVALNQVKEPLTGNLVKDGDKTPFVLFLMGKEMQFQLPKTNEIFQMRLGDESLSLYNVVNGKAIPFPEAKFSEPVAGTDVSYEDLALRFLYWPNPRIEAEESINGFDCYKLRVDKPKSVSGRIAAVFVWIAKKQGAFIHVEGYDRNSAKVKEFNVLDVMQLSDNSWMLKKMQVSSFDASGRKSSVTNLVFDDVVRRASRPTGLR